MSNIFNIVKRIQTTKDDWNDIPEAERATFNSYMCNKVLSMNQDYVELVNIVQKNTWQMKAEHLYNLYKDIIPKGYVFSKYIKSTTKKEHNWEHIFAVMKYYEVSRREAKQYIELLSKKEIEKIVKQINGK